MNLSFNGIRKEWITVLRLRKPYWATRKRNILTSPGKPGGHLTSTDISPLVIPVRIEIQGNSESDYHNKSDEFVQWLDMDEPAPLIFDRYPNRTYYAVVDGNLDPLEIVSIGFVDVIFVCPDPFSYGPEQASPLNGSPILVNGTAPTDPNFTVTLKEPTTFLAISNGDKMNLVGNPLSVEDSPAQRLTRRYWSEADSLIGWTAPSSVEGGAVSGTMATDGFKFYASDYGTGTAWHGPARKASLPEILTNFQVDALVELHNNDGWGKVIISGLDQANNVVFSMSMGDAYSTPQALGIVRAGNQGAGHNIISHIGNPPVWNNFQGLLRIGRNENSWYAYISRFNMRTGKYDTGMFKTWEDKENVYTRELSQIQVQIVSYGSRTPAVARLEDIKVYRINDLTPDEIPYIGVKDDVFEFDHKNDVIYRNGEIITKEKSFIGEYFELTPGYNTLVAEPVDAIESAEVKWRDKYL